MAKVSWLAQRSPPNPLIAEIPVGEARLWWAVIRESGKDLINGHESLALDAAEFLFATGVWLCDFLWGIEPAKTHRELLRLMEFNPHLQGRVRKAMGNVQT